MGRRFCWDDSQALHAAWMAQDSAPGRPCAPDERAQVQDPSPPMGSPVHTQTQEHTATPECPLSSEAGLTHGLSPTPWLPLSSSTMLNSVINYSTQRSNSGERGSAQNTERRARRAIWKPEGTQEGGATENAECAPGRWAPGRAGGQEGGAINIADDGISHEERHHAHHTGQGKSDNRTPTHTGTHAYTRQAYAHTCTHAHRRWISVSPEGT